MCCLWAGTSDGLMSKDGRNLVTFAVGGCGWGGRTRQSQDLGVRSITLGPPGPDRPKAPGVGQIHRGCVLGSWSSTSAGRQSCEHRITMKIQEGSRMWGGIHRGQSQEGLWRR